ncbi:2-hydroxyacid dehydrogenase [Croceicoccus mobilis]|uniref:D-glycerate dehydrogenase n=1 Tax=Croceicoccus mobilis TaxID=1703339 RepID=A0A916Z556_9SPHN|nr:D-glycerate dehydrogenase [Croceicoccus mobilis]GGD76517.1 D-glycerate dehydrogenase [Croceicoccus mobilis]
MPTSPSMTTAATTRRIEGKPRVIVTRRLMPEIESRMSELFDAVLNSDDHPFSDEEMAAAVKDCDVLVPTVTDNIDPDLLEKAGDRLKLLANFGAGTDHIALAAARARRIVVTNTPGVFTDDTADLAMALIIGVMRRMREGTRIVRHGEWGGWTPTGMLGRSIGGKRLGIVGMGRIGQAVAHRARAFGMQIIYYNRRRLPESVERIFGADYAATVDELVAASDIVTLHCPTNAETHHLIDTRRISLMKPGAVLVNTGRGELVDQEAMITALENGQLWGAGLDVYPDEPNVDERLIAHPNVITQPHIGSATEEGRTAAGLKIIANIQSWADGHSPPDRVIEGYA